MTKSGLLWLHLGLSFGLLSSSSCKPTEAPAPRVIAPQSGASNSRGGYNSDDETDDGTKNQAGTGSSKVVAPRQDLGIPAPAADKLATNTSTNGGATAGSGLSDLFSNGGGITSLISQFLGNSGGLGALGGSGGLGSLTSLFGGGAQNFTGAPTNTAATSAPVTPQSVDDLRKACLDTINQYRSSIGRSALTLKADAGACLDKQSADDGAVGGAHRNFGKCGESAQNECPGWGGDPGTAQAGCLKMMWAEGPGGGHYENMANARYSQVACGYAQVGGKWWMIQNFYR
jgi:hypothetical protein